MESHAIETVELFEGGFGAAAAVLSQYEAAGILPHLTLVWLTGRRAMERGKMEEEETLATVVLSGYTTQDLQTAAEEAYRVGVTDSASRRLPLPIRKRYDLKMPATR